MYIYYYIICRQRSSLPLPIYCMSKPYQDMNKHLFQNDRLLLTCVVLLSPTACTLFHMCQVTVLQQAEASGGSVSKEMLAASLGWDITR
jgi:hypothetical protein